MYLRSVAKSVFGEHHVSLADLTMASEDFAFMAQKASSVISRLVVSRLVVSRSVVSSYAPLIT